MGAANENNGTERLTIKSGCQPCKIVTLSLIMPHQNYIGKQVCTKSAYAPAQTPVPVEVVISAIKRLRDANSSVSIDITMALQQMRPSRTGKQCLLYMFAIWMKA